ncbi:MAG: GNAT family N-acetyltransferase [Burkholderiales bacterium]|nr:GNAT family N-acetyltransferase [Burkholderiales bacterium]
MQARPAPGYRVRPAVASDADALLRLMRGLAHFEGYLDRFTVDAPALLARGLGGVAPPQFGAFVAEHDSGALCAHAVWLLTPFTFDLRPTVVLKELYVDAAHRRRGLAAALFRAVQHQAGVLGAGRLQWLVLPDNERAKQLYRALGGQHDTAWETWALALPGVAPPTPGRAPA